MKTPKSTIFYLIAFILMLSFSSLALTDEVSTVWVDGQIGIDPFTANEASDSFTLTVKAQIADNANAKAVKAKIIYDPTKLNVAGTNSLTDATWTIGTGFDANTPGEIIFQKSCLFGCISANGLFNIASINFNILGGVNVGETLSIDLSNDFVSDTKVLTGEINHITSVTGTQITRTECIPQCAGKQCGPDGCGGSCGTCLQGQNCQNNQCILIQQGYTKSNLKTDVSICIDQNNKLFPMISCIAGKLKLFFNK
ncbi:hypothetical protein HOC13_00400 [Candidatus Woesearchaeota archaeon]|jgi:hypothetical protein|nr:hypothetical protein [Candidatus Woesearchaeota archaeon]